MEIGAREGPLEGSGGLFVALLEGEEAIFDFVERAEVVGGEDLSLDDREVDFDLVEPARMYGVWTSTIEGQVARRRLQAFSPRWDEPLSVIQKTRRADR